MIIADIIIELSKVNSTDLQNALAGIRFAYKIFPPQLKKELLTEYSNTEYSILSALRIATDYNDTNEQTVFDMYRDSLV